jgi:hypothetical protein
MTPPTLRFRFGPPRFFFALAALGGGIVANFDDLLKMELSFVNLVETLGVWLAIGLINLTWEAIRWYLRVKVAWVRFDQDGLFDRLRLKTPIPWDEIDWIEPHPGNYPDRLRVGLKAGAKSRLTAWGAFISFVKAKVSSHDSAEVAIDFAGLDPSCKQAASWLAAYQPALIDPVWDHGSHRPAPAIEASEAAEATAPASAASTILLEASTYHWSVRLELWLSKIIVALAVIGLPVGLVAIGHFLGVDARDDFLESLFDGHSGWIAAVIFIFGLVPVVRVLIMHHVQDQMGDYITIETAGLRDARISADLIAWHEIEHISLSNSGVRNHVGGLGLSVQLRDGVRLSPPAPLYFKLLHVWRSYTTPETFELSTVGTTTSPSEIVTLIERHELPVALREP